jgi:GntR family transcriptional regulator
MDDRTQRIIARIQTEIRRGDLRAGERLGSERELAERFAEPRSALRAALEVLEAQDLIRRTMGRQGGVFVSDGRIERHLNTILGVPEMLRQQGMRSSTSILRSTVELAGPGEQRALHLPSGANVYRIVRVREANGRPWSLDTSVVPADLTPGLLSHDLTRSLYEILRTEYGLEAEHAEETIDVQEADSYVASVLGIETGSSLVQIWRTTIATNGAVMEFAHDLFRGDRTRVHLRRFGARWKRVGSE